ncbi:MAG: hypothetical protein ACRDT4_17520 [Micromonosporaceae bacterium]
MTGLRLFVRSRRLLATAGALLAVNAAGVTIGAAELRVNEHSDVGLPWLLFLPLASACLIGLSLRSPLHDFDLTAARSLPLWRLGQIAALATGSALAITALASQLQGAFGPLAAIRNLIGLLGLALLGARLIGGRLAWLLPCLWLLAATTMGDPRSTLPPWDWPVRHDNDFPAIAVALLLAVAGLAAATTGTKEPRGDVD